MLKYIKHNLDTIDGVAIYPIISLLLFLGVFLGMLYFVFKMKKSNIDEVSQFPLDSNSINSNEDE
ncbi:MAG: CcoQ/FixQ family Cbb3-type cytochrome c oxidase assembly chaperone [Flavobacteriaceae bacterium]|nr:MAG: CcoQ/FixQ family Cbb3-type cytochrome c oxidase assembly chaperone [Flavobacteriaceae bacterium]